MKLRQRFFNGTAFQKDITRFAPFWALYLIGGLMVALPTISSYDTIRSVASAVNALSNAIGPFGIINFLYAALVAQLLFGDLYNSKLCNALHAMPLRRESWFVAHLASGLLFSLVPNLVMALCLMPYLQEYWFTALLWLLAMEMHYVFFFGLMVFAMQCTGNRFSAIIVYIILNFFSILVLYLMETIYTPMLYGVVLNVEDFTRFCPLVSLLQDRNYFHLTHLGDCPCYLYDNGDVTEHLLRWDGLGGSWGYLSILLVLGLVFLGLGLVLYRKRNLESAGDFVAFRWMKPIFWIIFTLCAGGAMQFFGEEIMGLSRVGGFIFLAIGLLCGFFVSQMFIARSIKVFKKRNFLHLAIFLVAFLLTVGFTALDVFGVQRYVPSADQVEAVFVGSHYVSNLSWEEAEKYADGNPCFFGTADNGQIPAVLEAHRQLLEAPNGRETSADSTRMEVVYFLKNGRKVIRVYYPESKSEATQTVWKLESQPQMLFRVDSLEQWKDMVTKAEVDYLGSANGPALETLLEAMWADGQAGCIGNRHIFHFVTHGDGDEYRFSITLTYAAEGKLMYSRTFSIYSCCENTIRWVEENDVFAHLGTWTPERLAKEVGGIYYGGLAVEDKDEIITILQLLQKDMERGSATLNDVVWKDFVAIEAILENGKTRDVYLSTADSEVYSYLKKAVADGN